MDNFNYGENLRIVRQAKGISQEAMAFHLNISQASYSRIEGQSETQDYHQVLEIAKVLEVSICELIPNLKEIDIEAMHSIHGSGAVHKTKDFLNTPLGFIVLLACSLFLINVVYVATKAYCSALGTSENTMFFAGGAAALATIAIIYYSVRKFRNSGGKIGNI